MNKGDKYIVEIAEVQEYHDENGNEFELGRVKGFKALTLDEVALKKLEPVRCGMWLNCCEKWLDCLGIKLVIEGDILKVKWRHYDKHYMVSLAALLELWEKYKEQEHG